MVARFVRDEEVVGLNPATPTTTLSRNRSVIRLFPKDQGPHFRNEGPDRLTPAKAGGSKGVPMGQDNESGGWPLRRMTGVPAPTRSVTSHRLPDGRRLDALAELASRLTGHAGFAGDAHRDWKTRASRPSKLRASDVAWLLDYLNNFLQKRQE